MKLDKEQAIKSLTLIPSMSQTGKMAELTMSRDSLAKSGQSSFLTIRKKKTKLGIIVAEVVDAKLLDPFGTGMPGMDVGRNNELLSSPRDHPQLLAKQNSIIATEKQQAFRKSVLPGEITESVEDRERKIKEEQAREKLERHKRMFIMDDEDSLDSDRKLIRPSACMLSHNPSPKMTDAPPIGHYRPKFTVVESRTPFVKFRHRHHKKNGRVSPLHSNGAKGGFSSATASGGGGGEMGQASVTLIQPTGSGAVETAGKPGGGGAGAHGETDFDMTTSASFRRFDSMGPDALAMSVSAASPTTAEAGTKALPPGATGADGTTAAAGGGQANVKVKAVKPTSPKGSSMFMSRTPNRPPYQATTANDKWYYPYNENIVFPRPKVGLLDFNLQLNREQGKQLKVSHHDVVYETDRYRINSGYISFDKQLPREQASGFAITASTAAAASGAVLRYDVETASKASSTCRRTPVVNFRSRSSSSPTMATTASMLSGSEMDLQLQQQQALATYDVKETERTAQHHRTPVVNFEKFSARPQFLRQLPSDLDYQPNFQSVWGRTRLVRLEHISPHRELFQHTETANCDYHPNYTATLPRSPSACPFATATARREAASTHLVYPKSLDRFYDTDTAVTIPRPSGNPMMATHMSRDQRNRALTRNAISPDRFYDYDPSVVQPRSGQSTTVIEFAKTVGREQPVITHLLSPQPAGVSVGIGTSSSSGIRSRRRSK